MGVDCEEDVNTFVDALIDGLTRSTDLILANLGITIPLESLPSFAAKKQAEDDWTGTGIAGRLFARFIRPWLMPGRHKALRGKVEALRLQVQSELLNAILDKGDN